MLHNAIYIQTISRHHKGAPSNTKHQQGSFIVSKHFIIQDTQYHANKASPNPSLSTNHSSVLSSKASSSSKNQGSEGQNIQSTEELKCPYCDVEFGEKRKFNEHISQIKNNSCQPRKIFAHRAKSCVSQA